MTKPKEIKQLDCLWVDCPHCDSKTGKCTAPIYDIPKECSIRIERILELPRRARINMAIHDFIMHDGLDSSNFLKVETVSWDGGHSVIIGTAYMWIISHVRELMEEYNILAYITSYSTDHINVRFH